MNVKPGFWDCCNERPAKAVLFYDDNGNEVWHKACAGCASTVTTDRVKDLPTESYAIVYTVERYNTFTQEWSDAGYRSQTTRVEAINLRNELRNSYPRIIKWRVSEYLISSDGQAWIFNGRVTVEF